MSKKKTHEEYVKELAETNPNIEVVGKYVDSRTKISHRCKICNHEWAAAPDKILRGRGCPKCAGNIKLTHEEYVEKVKNINPNIEVLGKYTNYTTVVSAMMGVISLFFTPLTSVIGHLCVEENKEHVKEYFNFFHGFNYVIAVVFFLGYYAVIDNLVTICFGQNLEIA